jgi:hypothetical protein
LQRQKFVFEIIDEGIAIGQQELDMMFNKLKTLNDTSGTTESRLVWAFNCQANDPGNGRRAKLPQ